MSCSLSAFSMLGGRALRAACVAACAGVAPENKHKCGLGIMGGGARQVPTFPSSASCGLCVGAATGGGRHAHETDLLFQCYTAARHLALTQQHVETGFGFSAAKKQQRSPEEGHNLVFTTKIW